MGRRQRRAVGFLGSGYFSFGTVQSGWDTRPPRPCQEVSVTDEQERRSFLTSCLVRQAASAIRASGPLVMSLALKVPISK